MGIHLSIHVFSEMDVTIETPNAPDEWALNICKAIPGVDDPADPSGAKVGLFTRINNIFYQELKFQTTPENYSIDFYNLFHKLNKVSLLINSYLVE